MRNSLLFPIASPNPFKEFEQGWYPFFRDSFAIILNLSDKQKLALFKSRAVDLLLVERIDGDFDAPFQLTELASIGKDVKQYLLIELGI